jgi:uncharacterized membrane protein
VLFTKLCKRERKEILLQELSENVVVSVAAGILLSGLNTLVGVIIANRSADKPVRDAISMILGGMTVRFFVMGLFVWLALAVLHLHRLGFALALMISFFVFLLIEGFFFHTSYERNKKPIVRKKRTRFPDYDQRESEK